MANVNAILGGRGGSPPATDRARALAGPDALAGHAATAAALKRVVRGGCEAAVARNDVAALSEPTPLIRLLDMTKLGVRLCLQYLQACLCQEMVYETPDCAALAEAAPAVDLTGVPKEEGMSRAAMRRREEERRNRETRDRSVPVRLTRIYNTVSCFEFLA